MRRHGLVYGALIGDINAGCLKCGIGLGDTCERFLVLIHQMNVGPGLSKGLGNGEANTATLQVILQNHLARCWRNSLDAPHPDELAVEVELSLNRNGELMGPPRLIDQGRILSSPNPYLRVAGERALRAASLCAPYPLPPEQYSEWRQITANFAPSLYGN